MDQNILAEMGHLQLQYHAEKKIQGFKIRDIHITRIAYNYVNNSYQANMILIICRKLAPQRYLQLFKKNKNK